MEFNPHAEGVSQNAEEDEALEPVVVDKEFHVLLESAEAVGNASALRPKSPGRLGRHRQFVGFVSQVIDALLHVLVQSLGQVISGAVFQVLGIKYQLSSERGRECSGKRQELLFEMHFILAPLLLNYINKLVLDLLDMTMTDGCMEKCRLASSCNRGPHCHDQRVVNAGQTCANRSASFSRSC